MPQPGFCNLKERMLILPRNGSVFYQPMSFRNNSISEDYLSTLPFPLTLNLIKLNKNKKVFLIIGTSFLIIVFLISIDRAKSTTFPGSKGNREQRLLEDAGSSSGQER